VAVFRDDPDVTAIGVVALRCQLLTFPLNALMIYSNMMLQTIRMPLQANLLASARHGLFFIPLIIILPYYLGLFGVEVCQAVSDALSFLLTIPILWQTMKKLRNGNINRS
jgi:Na+-driven multidrug efflux pump